MPGFLFPFGHRASLIKITERKFHLRKLGLGGKSVPVAYLRQRMYIIVKEREKNYPGPGQHMLARRISGPAHTVPPDPHHNGHHAEP